MNKLLTIIVTFNGKKWIEKCLNSIFISSYPSDIFVIDNGSSDGTLEYLEQNSDKIILIKSKQNLGFGKANNLGLKYAIENNYSYIYLLNQDAWVFENTFEELIKVLDNNQDIGIISPLQITASQKSLDDGFDHYCPPKMISDALCSNLKDFYYCNFVMAAHWMISYNCLNRLGGFSPAFKHYGEDYNYIQRAIFKNFKIAISTRSRAIHDRENRKKDDKKEKYLKYVYALIIINNPLEKHKFLNLIKYYLGNIVTDFCWLNISYFLKSMREYLFKRSLYRLSLKDNVFLS